MAIKKVIIDVTGLMKPHFGGGLPAIYKEQLKVAPVDTKVYLFRWGTVEDIVDLIRKENPNYLCGAGHSYGVSTLMMVAAALEGEFIFDDILSTDGVWRDKIDLPQFKSLLKNHKIQVPKNVRRLWAWYQRAGLIQGHEFEVGPSTVLEHFTLVENYKHWNMDRVGAFKDKLMELTKW